LVHFLPPLVLLFSNSRLYISSTLVSTLVMRSFIELPPFGFNSFR